MTRDLGGLLHHLQALTRAGSTWMAELAGILPKSIRTAILPRVERLYLQLGRDGIRACRGTSESILEIGRYPLAAESLDAEQQQELEELAGRSREVVLCLPAGKVLTKSMTLPLVAEENLREVLGFEAFDPVTETAELKHCAIRVEKVG